MTVRRSWTASIAALVLVGAVACAPSTDGAGSTTGAPAPAPTPTTTSTALASTASTATTAPAPVEIALRLDRRVDDAATAGFETVVRETLAGPRGWQRAGFVFTFVADAPFTVVLAEGDAVDELCRPYDVGGRFSCQNGPVVALNADRWRHATPQWTGDLQTYRQMLVNHEVGHLLGQHHPDSHCPRPGQPAPVMGQQSTELHGCLPNPWPLEWEVECAALRLEPIAPGYEADPAPLCGPNGRT